MSGPKVDLRSVSSGVGETGRSDSTAQSLTNPLPYARAAVIASKLLNQVAANVGCNEPTVKVDPKNGNVIGCFAGPGSANVTRKAVSEVAQNAYGPSGCKFDFYTHNNPPMTIAAFYPKKLS